MTSVFFILLQKLPMEDHFDSYFDGETLSLVGRFENMIREDQHLFFDVDEFQEIIEYYFFKNEQRKAHMTITQALAQHPGNAGILVRLAQYHVNLSKDREALRILREIEHAGQPDSDLYIAKGNLYSQLEKPDKAIEAFKKAVDGAEFPDEVLSGIAFEYENMGSYDLAIEFLLKALDFNPDNEAALYEFAFCCEVSQQTNRCIEFLGTFLDRHPYSAAGWFNLGVAYSNIDLFEKAIEAYDYVLAIDETYSSAYFNKANCYANIENHEKAIETYTETFYYEDAEPVTHYYIAECYEKLRKFESAIEYYHKAVSLDPEFADAWLGLGVCHDELGKQQSALPFIQKAIRITPTIPDYWFILGDVQIKLSLIEDGISSYRKVIELDPDDPDIWLDLSVVYADRHDYEMGFAVLGEGLKFHGENADFHFGMAWYLFMMGRSQQANEMMIKALEMDADGHKRLFTTFPEAGRHDQVLDAIASFRK